MSSDAAAKALIRREMIERRAAADPAWRAEASRWIAGLALSLEQVLAARNIALYAARGAEADTAPLIAELLARKGGVLLPRVAGDDGLVFHQVREFPGALTEGAFGILEPTPESHPTMVPLDEIDVMFIPGLAFGQRGARIGYGKGHYDRLLAGRHHAGKFGLCFEFQVVDGIQTDPHDVPMDGIVTDERIILARG